MQIETIVVNDKDGFVRMTAKVQNKVAIEVEGFGCGEYRWMAVAQLTGPENVSQAQIDEALNPNMGEKDADGFFSAPASFGQGATWWEPKTFAHAVWDIINNQ